MSVFFDESHENNSELGTDYKFPKMFQINCLSVIETINNV